MEARHESPETTSLPIAHPSGVVAAPRLPLPVMLVWMCALAGLAVYTASWYVPSLAAAAGK
jgi:hypothetical protein